MQTHWVRRTFPRWVIVVVVFVVVGCGTGVSPSAAPTAAPPVRRTATPSISVAATAIPAPSHAARSVDLAAIVVAPEAAPPRTGHDYTGVGVEARLRPVVSGRASEFLALKGFIAGRYTEFSGDGGLFMSLGLLFDSDGNAGEAFELYLDELQSDDGYAATGSVDVEFGDEGLCAEFDNPGMGGIHENACLWRNQSLVLIAGGTIPRPDMRAVAETMDDRASSALAEL